MTARGPVNRARTPARGEAVATQSAPPSLSPSPKSQTPAHALPVENPTTETRRERRRREVFERLVDAARTLMFTHALDQTTVQEITDVADVGKGTFFNYFRSKEHVVPQIVRERTRLLEQTIDQVRSGQLSARQAIITHFTKHLWPASTTGDWLIYYGSILRSLTHNDEIRTEVAETLKFQTEQFVELVAIGQNSGEFRTDCTASELGTYVDRIIYGVGLVSWIRRVPPLVYEDDALVKLIIGSLVAPASRLPHTPKTAARTSSSTARPARRPLKRHRSR